MVRLSPLIWTPKIAHVLSSASRAIRKSLFSTSSGTTTPASVKDCGPSSISSPPMEKDLRSLAHQDHHGRYPPAMGSGPAPIQSPLRFCDLSAKSLKGIRRLQQDTSALSRNRLRGPITKSGRDGWSLVNILPGGQEGDGQASGLHRSPDDQPVPQVRALQDGGHSHACKHAPPPRLDDQNRPVRLLHASICL